MNAWFALPALALIAGVLALTPLGSQVLRRGVVFIDLAVAQAAAAAVIATHALMPTESLLQDQLAATLGAVLVSLLIAALARRWPAQREALIGLLYVAGACLALLGASAHPHGRDKLLQLLAADVLWVDAVSVLGLCLAAALVWALQQQQRLMRDSWFYAAFAVVASVAVPALGLFLVFASLIAPALWIEKGLHPSLAMAAAGAASLLGLAASWWLDTPSGPSVVLALALLGLGAVVAQGRGPH
jgi:zinc/manganese transport system permease protein